MPDQSQTTQEGPTYEGRDALKAGVRYDDCPYPYTGKRGSDWWKWTTGWSIAKRAKERLS